MTYLLWIPGLCLLLLEPATWLLRSWRDPSHGGGGALVAALVVALAVRSVGSGPARPTAIDRRVALGLLVLTSSVRLAGARLGIAHLSALALVSDVAALGLLLALHRRPWAVGIGWWAALFALSLPVEQVLQRLVAYPMRLSSAAITEALLRPVLPELSRQGTLLVQPGATLSVDLPCSGAVGLTVLVTFAVAVACRRRVDLKVLAQGTASVLLGALVANVSRLVLLLIGPTEALLVEPWHGLVGLVGIGLGAVPALALAHSLSPRTSRPSASSPAPSSPAPSSPSTPFLGGAPAHAWLHAAMGLGFTGLAAVIVGVPAHPVDVSARIDAPGLPAFLGPHASEIEPLTEQESAYFGRFGGQIERRRYTSGHTVLMLRTTSPLRHLHRPAACLRGAGHELERLGVRHGAVPTTVWRTTDPQGDTWRIEVSFVSDRGEVAESASEVAWRWLWQPDTTWTLIERISPFALCEADPARCADLERTLHSALDMGPALASWRTP